MDYRDPPNPPAGEDDEHQSLCERLAFLALTQRDAERLRAVQPIFETVADEFVEAFYRHLASFEETARFLRDGKQVARLKGLQRDHFRSMLEASWDADYVQRRRRVGQTHAEVGIEPQFFLAAYTQFLTYYLAQCGGETGEPSERLGQTLSLVKAVFLDIGLALDAYFEQSTDDLRQALQMLWKLNSELKQFAQFTSHDLKTPLGTVANLCEEAIDEFGGEMPAEAREMIDAARRTVFRMSSTIDELLAASSPAEQPQPPDEVSVESLIDDVLERLGPMAQRKGVEFVIAKPLPTVRGNRAQLREVFYNLLANAVKYGDKHPHRIEVVAQTEAGCCVVCVSDNGPGIPAEEQKRIFAPFRRLATHRDEPGTGLGLYFAKMLIEGQGGRIWVESQPGVGSRFYVELQSHEA